MIIVRPVQYTSRVAQYRELFGALGLAEGLILLPSNRARSAVQAAFVRAGGNGLLMPRLAVIGDADLDGGRVLGMLDQNDVVGRFTGGALDLFVAGVPDQQDLQALAREPAGLVVHFGDQRAGGVDGLQAPFGGLGVHRRRHAVGREHHGGTFGNFGELLYEDGAARLEILDDVPVVDDLLPHVHGWSVQVERPLDRDHGPVDARAVSARRGHDNAFGHGAQSRRRR